MQAVIIGKLSIVYIVVTLLFCLCAWLSGNLRAKNWLSLPGTLAYAILMALGHRFLCYALAQAELLSLVGFIVSGALLITVSFISFRLYRSKTMVRQYPWIYEMTGPFSYREKP